MAPFFLQWISSQSLLSSVSTMCSGGYGVTLVTFISALDDSVVSKSQIIAVPEPAAAKAAAQRRAAAARTRKWRRSRAVAGVPEARDVDRAISEAVSFQLRRVVLLTSVASGPSIQVADIFRVAVIALVRDGADRSEAKKAVRGRLEPRPEHEHPGYAPSMTPTRSGIVMKPKRADAFHPADVAYLRDIAGIRRDDPNP